MNTKWMTLPELALDRGISLADAQVLVEQSNCPKVFKTAGTYYLL